jgi:FkbM family methyltransferase
MADIARLIHSISLRLPQKYLIRTGLRVKASSAAEHVAFWNNFTSSEFLRFIPFLIKSGIAPVNIIDCGAACGYFSLLMEHLQRAGVFEWHTNFILVEPAAFNIAKLKDHFGQKGFEGRVQIYENIVGLKSGSVVFKESSNMPFGGSVKHDRTGTISQTKSYLNLSPLLQEKCLLKIDIEGSEYDFFREYAHDLGQVEALIVDWHKEHEKDDEHLTILANAGFEVVTTSIEARGRATQLFLRRK